MTTKTIEKKVKKDSFETGCCPQFDPKEWQEKEIIFDEKLFLKDQIRSVFHIPINFGMVMKRNMKIIENAKAKADDFVLTDEKSLWETDLLIGVDKKIANAEIIEITGTFLSKVFEGPYKNMNRYIEEMTKYVEDEKGKKILKNYFGYPYCPKCAKAYGTNYIVILSQIDKPQ